MSDMSFSGDFIAENLGIRPLTPEELGQIAPEALAAAGTPGSVQETQPVSLTEEEFVEPTETEAERIARLDREQRAREFAAIQAGDAAAAQARRVDAFQALRTLLNRYGLSALEQNVQDLIARGITDGKAILFNLRETETFKTRFAGNAARAKKGLPELDPDTYIGLEESYRDTLRSNGLPVGFYDEPNDFRKLIEGDVSSAELQTRITQGYRLVQDADPEVKRQMQTLYGIDESQLAAYFIDPERSAPLLTRQAKAAQVSARAREQAGFQLTALSAEDLIARGYTPDEAQTAFTQAGQLAGLYQEMGGEEALTEAQKIGAAFGYDVAATQALEQRKRARLGEFQGGGGFARTTGATSGTVETGVGTAQ